METTQEAHAKCDLCQVSQAWGLRMAPCGLLENVRNGPAGKGGSWKLRTAVFLWALEDVRRFCVGIKGERLEAWGPKSPAITVLEFEIEPQESSRRQEALGPWMV